MVGLLRARVAKLEAVRDAANDAKEAMKRNHIGPDYVWNNLIDALAAAEEG